MSMSSSAVIDTLLQHKPFAILSTLASLYIFICNTIVEGIHRVHFLALSYLRVPLMMIYTSFRYDPSLNIEHMIMIQSQSIRTPRIYGPTCPN